MGRRANSGPDLRRVPHLRDAALLRYLRATRPHPGEKTGIRRTFRDIEGGR